MDPTDGAANILFYDRRADSTALEGRLFGLSLALTRDSWQPAGIAADGM